MALDENLVGCVMLDNRMSGFFFFLRMMSVLQANIKRAVMI